MANFTLAQLSYFVAVAETGSFVGAAGRENVTSTAIASSITQLERNLGVQLCVRRRAHGIELTRTGHVLLAEARALLSKAEESDRMVRGGGEELVGPLMVGCYGNFAPTVLPGLIEAFGERHPRVDLNFRIASQDVLQDQLLDGRLDVAIVYDLALRPGLVKRELYALPVHIIVSAKHRFAGRGTVRLEELADDPYILFESPPAGGQALRIFEDHGIAPNVRFRSEQLELTRALVARNLGYCMMIYRTRSTLSYEGLPLVRLEIDPPMPDERVVAVWPRGMPMSPRAAAFVRFAEEYVVDHRDAMAVDLRGAAGDDAQ